MKNKLFTLLALLLVFGITNAFAQTVIPIVNGQNYIEDFESGTLGDWTVDSLTDALCAEYEVDRDRAFKDVGSIVESWKNVKVVE